MFIMVNIVFIFRFCVSVVCSLKIGKIRICVMIVML